DALIDYSGTELVTDENAKPITRWDGRTTKTNPTTGKEVPDETAREPVYRYIKPKPNIWPKADFIVGNPPFLGAKYIKNTMGEGYQEALWSAYKEKDVPRSADFVMYWWHKAAQLTRLGKTRRFGFITTNSITQTFSRRISERHMREKNPISLVYAVADHPWIDAAQCAAVRIAISVGAAGNRLGRLGTVAQETKATDGMSHDVELDVNLGKIHANLRIGADLTSAQILRANGTLSSPGVKLHGSGFIVTPDVAKDLGLGSVKGLKKHIRSYRHGRDLMGNPRGVMVIDLFGLSDVEVRKRFPKVYQHVFDHVKPERDQNNRASYRNNWWIFGEPRKDLRPALKGHARYIATVETAKHRVFQFLDISILPDNKIVAIALPDAWHLGVLSSRVHVVWALAKGGQLGPTPVYPKSECFDQFPFPDTMEKQKTTIRDLPEQFDAVRAVIGNAETPLRAEEVARTFSRANKTKVAEVLTTLEGLSQIHRVGTERFAA
ncbi:MAG: hypothetical protein JKY92_08340, partial [Magnetovibrio sp.]|nr:hypothetical protein [Magnetovibrio sp.]